MGHKVSPLSFRLGYIRDWSSRWYAKKSEFSKSLLGDARIREYIRKNFASANVSKVEIERLTDKVRVIIHTSRPGIIIGRRGSDIDRLKEELQNIADKQVEVDIKEVKNPALDAQLVAQNVALQLEKRVAFRRTMKRAIQMAIEGGAKGIKITCGGRLAGAEMARSETFKSGKIPLQTIRADIDYGTIAALTTYGYIGVKVWIYKGDIFKSNAERTGNQKPTTA